MNELTRKEFAQGLRDQLAQGHDPVQIARWASDLHLSVRSFAKDVESDLLQLMAMDTGEEFELTEEALQELARRES
jgi:hypothetical protein